jgi:RNA polymerase sigma-70 factor (ECF subfamily)
MNIKKNFEQFYKEHIDKVYRFVFFHVDRNKDLTEDLVSEIFMKALKNFSQYDERVSKSSWIMTIARNHLINYWRDQKKVVALPEVDDEDRGLEDVWHKLAKETFEKLKDQQEVYAILAKMSEIDRELVTFHYILGYTYKEIGEMRGSSEGAVRVALHRILKSYRTDI